MNPYKLILLAATLLLAGAIKLNAQQTARSSTASANVQIVDTAFYMPQLKRTRRIWIYLPRDYKTSRKKFPVLYLHDGQNVFDEATAFAGEWGVDETLDSLSATWPQCIVVAIANGAEKRLGEYSPYDFTLRGNNGDSFQVKGEGDAYVDFLVQTLRPYILKNYKARRYSRHHYTAGSSMGGLISLYALLKYPKKWGGAGIFSPAFWVVKNELLRDLEKRGRRVRSKLYFYAGREEGNAMVPDMLAVLELMNRVSKARMTSVIRTEGKHNEPTWRQEFPLFYKWLMGRGK